MNWQFKAEFSLIITAFYETLAHGAHRAHCAATERYFLLPHIDVLRESKACIEELTGLNAMKFSCM